MAPERSSSVDHAACWTCKLAIMQVAHEPDDSKCLSADDQTDAGRATDAAVM